MGTKTKRTIQVEYKRIMSQVTALEDCSSDLNALSVKLDNLVDSLGSCWQGDSAALFASKCVALKSKVSSSASEIGQIAEKISAMAEIYREAELQALEQVNMFSGGAGNGGGGGGGAAF
ncbi:MAG: WXG100 family type VII secretion target [Lachnospiraceae bacterium]|nr:WXG100 family type VII secretion target [Lachnospiraceae bacterium]